MFLKIQEQEEEQEWGKEEEPLLQARRRIMLSNFNIDIKDWTARTQHSSFFLLFSNKLIAMSSLVGM